MSTSILIHTLTRKSLHLPRFLRKQFYVRWNRLIIRLSIGGEEPGEEGGDTWAYLSGYPP